jgi:hypothetical protein
MWFLRAFYFCRVLVTNKKAAPNTIPVNIPPSEKGYLSWHKDNVHHYDLPHIQCYHMSKGAGSGSLLTAVIAIGASFVTILILTYRNKVLSSLTMIEEPKYSVLVPPYTNGNIASAYISKVGIRSFNNAAEFKPIEIGIVNTTESTATPSESSGNKIPFVPAYIIFR